MLATAEQSPIDVGRGAGCCCCVCGRRLECDQGCTTMMHGGSAHGRRAAIGTSWRCRAACLAAVTDRPHLARVLPSRPGPRAERAMRSTDGLSRLARWYPGTHLDSSIPRRPKGSKWELTLNNPLRAWRRACLENRETSPPKALPWIALMRRDLLYNSLDHCGTNTRAQHSLTAAAASCDRLHSLPAIHSAPLVPTRAVDTPETQAYQGAPEVIAVSDSLNPSSASPPPHPHRTTRVIEMTLERAAARPGNETLALASGTRAWHPPVSAPSNP